ncbi:MAG: S49 family peptidase [Planctomycetota bacterium]
MPARSMSTTFRVLASFGLVMASAAGAQVDKKSATVDTEEAVVGLIKISGSLAERPGPFDWLTGDGAMTVRSIVAAVEDASQDDDIRAIVVQLEDASLTTTEIEELASAFQSTPKEVIVVGESFGTSQLLLGAHADAILAQSGAALSMPGMYMEEFYLRDMLEWIGAEPSFVQIGDFKGADETMMNTEPSEAWDENISGLLDSLYGNMRETIKLGRDLTDAELDAAMTEAWFASTDDGVALGLIDQAVSLNDLTEHLEARTESDVTWRTDLVESASGSALDPSNPFAIFSLLSQEPSNNPTRPTIAVLHFDGPIVDGDSSEGGLFGSSSVGSRTIRRIANELAEDDLIKGVVVRINSPGGSATASEVMWQSLRALAEAKPVYVSVGTMAASGGYYVAVAGDRVFVNPSSIVGSIGVVGGKIAIDGVMENLRINVKARSRGPRADLFGSDPWDADQAEAVRTKMQETYDLFTSRVLAGREGIDLSKTAEGRLFTGNVAVGLDMADGVASLTEVIEMLAGDLDLRSYDVLDYPGPMSFEDLLGQFSSSVSAPGGAAGQQIGSAAMRAIGSNAEALFGPAWPAVRARIDAVLMLRDHPVMLLHPTVLSIR